VNKERRKDGIIVARIQGQCDWKYSGKLLCFSTSSIKNSETPRVSHQITDQDMYCLCTEDSKHTY